MHRNIECLPFAVYSILINGSYLNFSKADAYNYYLFLFHCRLVKVKNERNLYYLAFSDKKTHKLKVIINVISNSV